MLSRSFGHGVFQQSCHTHLRDGTTLSGVVPGRRGRRKAGPKVPGDTSRNGLVNLFLRICPIEWRAVGFIVGATFGGEERGGGDKMPSGVLRMTSELSEKALAVPLGSNLICRLYRTEEMAAEMKP